MKSIGMLFALPLTMATASAQDYIMAKPEASPPGASGWVWESLADTVMGGNSELMPPAFIDADGTKALLLAGRVVTKGGGFIQVRLKHEKGRFDASAYSGVESEAASTLRKNVRTGSSSSVALVAAFEDFNAYHRIYKTGFYR